MLSSFGGLYGSLRSARSMRNEIESLYVLTKLIYCDPLLDKPIREVLEAKVSDPDQAQFLYSTFHLSDTRLPADVGSSSFFLAASSFRNCHSR